MARTTIKGTYSLDPETVRLLNQLARQWRVSKSEALRRSIRSAAANPSADTQAAALLTALDQLQGAAAVSLRGAARWANEVRAERRAHKQDGAQPR
jgi:hypothetical protein